MWTVHAAPAAALVAHCAQVGVDLAGRLLELGLERAILDDPGGRLPVRNHALLWRYASQQTADPTLGAKVVQSIPRGTYGETFLVVANSPTVGSALQRLCHYSRWVDESLELTTVARPGGHGLSLRPLGGAPPEELQYEVYSLAMCCVGLLATTTQLQPIEVTFRSHEPVDAQALLAKLACPVAFSQPHTCIWFDEATWHRPVQGANGSLLRLVEGHFDSLLATRRSQPGVLARVSRILHAHIDGHRQPTLDSVAGQLGMSGRTLQRTLRGANASFSELVTQARMTSARSLLSDPDKSLAQVALTLGFSDQSAFSRAYKRWTGSPPTGLRARRK